MSAALNHFIWSFVRLCTFYILPNTNIKICNVLLYFPQVHLDIPVSPEITGTNGNTTSVGLLHLELMDEVSHVLGGGMPLLLMPTPESAEESCHLLSSSSGPSFEVRAFLLDLAAWLGVSSRQIALPDYSSKATSLEFGLCLLRHCIASGLPGCTSAILDALVRNHGQCPERLLHSTDTESMSLLHLAMRRGHPAIVKALVSWSLSNGVRLNWSLPGPSGLCPLHLAAMLPHGESVILSLLQSSSPTRSDVASAWLLCRAHDGGTPFQLMAHPNSIGTRKGTSKRLSMESLQQMAFQVLSQAAAEEVVHDVEPDLDLGLSDHSSDVLTSLGPLLSLPGPEASPEVLPEKADVHRRHDGAKIQMADVSVEGKELFQNHPTTVPPPATVEADNDSCSNTSAAAGSNRYIGSGSGADGTEMVHGGSWLWWPLLQGFNDRDMERQYVDYKVWHCGLWAT